jgi:Spy/CpxP family protein refolding chaperone
MKKLLLAGMIVATSLFAWGGEGGWHHGDRGNGGWHHNRGGKHYGRRGGYGFMSLIRNLNLTEVQIDKIRTIMAENRPYPINYNNSLNIKNGKFDEKSYIETREKICEENAKKRAEMISKIYSILTPAQKKQLESLINAKQ